MHIRLNRYETKNILLVNIEKIFCDIHNLIPVPPDSAGKATNRPRGTVLAKINIQRREPGADSEDPIYFYAKKSSEVEGLFSGNLYFVEMFDWQDHEDEENSFLFSSDRLSLLYLESTEGERLTCCVPKKEVEFLTASIRGKLSNPGKLDKFVSAINNIKKKVLGHGRRKF